MQGASQIEGHKVPAREWHRDDLQRCLRTRVQPNRARVGPTEVLVQEGEDEPRLGGALPQLREDDPTHPAGLPGREDLQHLHRHLEKPDGTVT